MGRKGRPVEPQRKMWRDRVGLLGEASNVVAVRSNSNMLTRTPRQLCSGAQHTHRTLQIKGGESRHTSGLSTGRRQRCVYPLAPPSGTGMGPRRGVFRIPRSFVEEGGESR